MADPTGVAWVDGVVQPLAQARVPVTDRGFLFADSVFDTVRTYGAAPFLLGDHLDRLRASAEAIALPVPWDDQALAGYVADTIEGRGFDDEAAVRIMVTRGEGGSGLALPVPTVPRLVILCRPAPSVDPRLREQGVSLARPRGPAVKKSAVPGHVKSGAYLPNILALRQGREAGGFEALLRGDDGSWREATTSNLFAVHGDCVTTPGAAAGILPGITRALVLALCAAADVAVQVQSLDDVALESADELFITSSLKEVLPAVALDGQPVGAGVPGPLTLRLQAAFSDAVATIGARGATRLAQVFR